jgi:hypothetical protein
MNGAPVRDDDKISESTRRRLAAKALWYALKYIQALPRELREWPDEQDMKHLLTTLYPAETTYLRKLAACRIGMLLDATSLAARRNEFVGSDAEWSAYVKRARAHAAMPDLMDERIFPDYCVE